MNNISFSLKRKQWCVMVGGMLVAIAITACSHSSTAPSPGANTSVSVSPAATSSPISSASPTSSPVEVGTDQQGAVQVVRSYYRAIARRDYEQAYSAWEGNGAASHQSLEQFRQGFANTASIAVDIGTPGELNGAAGSIYIEIPVTVTAVTESGTPQRFRGSYVLRRVNNVPGSTPEQRQWHLYSANITQTN
ncbi:MAG TPA: hypothetical protein V6C78_11105 [Crinalium sp.]